jgi:hypothetical protein
MRARWSGRLTRWRPQRARLQGTPWPRRGPPGSRPTGALLTAARTQPCGPAPASRRRGRAAVAARPARGAEGACAAQVRAPGRALYGALGARWPGRVAGWLVRADAGLAPRLQEALAAHAAGARPPSGQRVRGGRALKACKGCRGVVEAAVACAPFCPQVSQNKMQERGEVCPPLSFYGKKHTGCTCCRLSPWATQACQGVHAASTRPLSSHSCVHTNSGPSQKVHRLWRMSQALMDYACSRAWRGPRAQGPAYSTQRPPSCAPPRPTRPRRAPRRGVRPSPRSPLAPCARRCQAPTPLRTRTARTS